MTIADIIHNYNFTPEFLYVIRKTDGYGEIIQEWCSWNSDFPSCYMDAEVMYMNVINKYFCGDPALVIEFWED